MAEILQIEADPGDAQRVLEEVPLWFHTFALDAGTASIRRGWPGTTATASRCSGALAGRSVLDVGAFDGFYSFLAEAGGRGASWRSTTSSTSTGSRPAGAWRWRAVRASARSPALSTRASSTGAMDALDLVEPG